MAGEMEGLAKTEMGEAIKSGDLLTVKRLSEDEETVLLKDRKGNTYLHYVCTMYRPYIIYILAEAGINLNDQNKHGNTALHITSLHNECCHVGDLMALGVDAGVKNNDDKTACDLSAGKKFWNAIYNRYHPGLFEAIRSHDNDLILKLLNCWCKIYTLRDGQTARQYAASLKLHDVVFMFDQHRHTLDMIYGVLEHNLQKTKTSLLSPKCDINFLNQASYKEHIIQHAIRQGNTDMVALLCQNKADVNMSVRVNQFIRAPIYFEAISSKVNSAITLACLSANADLSLKDERGRSPLIYALDKCCGVVPEEIMGFMLDNGTPFTDRDMTGLTARDVARFARRKDLVKLIDQRYVKMVRNAQLEPLKKIIMDAYDSIMINYNYRDTYIYANGNESATTWQFLDSVIQFNECLTNLHKAIASGSLNEARRILSLAGDLTNLPVKECEMVDMLVNSKDKGGRTLLVIAVLNEKPKCLEMILQEYDEIVDINRKDNCFRTALHYACAAPHSESYRQSILAAGADESIRDVKGMTAEMYKDNKEMRAWFRQEKKKKYGLLMELAAIEKYEELRDIIISKDQGLHEFISATKHFKLPIRDFPKLLQPLMPDYKDLLFLAIDHSETDIAARLADIGCDCVRKEKYDYNMWTSDKSKQQIWYDAPSRAELHGRAHLAKHLRRRQSRQMTRAYEDKFKKTRVDMMPFDKILLL